MSLHGKVAIVTGAAGQLGRAVAAKLGQHGAHLVLLDKQRPSTTELEGTHGNVVACQADLLDRDQLLPAIQETIAPWGRVDLLCHIAGGFRMGPAVHETPLADWQFLTDLNATSLINIAHAVVPYMLAQSAGRIVTVGAGAAMRGKALMGAYCASKSSLIRLTESLSAELLDKNINVNCVLPSIIDTPDNRAGMPDADPARWVTPEALADVIAFLCSDLARAIHGVALPVTGQTAI
ncbi:SDR family NAD(P)-dependent oxidoreductase [Pseudorhodoferax sp.]|uniref:SDR family NAD(P)-dependent oxidoreductase n=1 Tax=Pseudorhodoferax sp. TaxID=1993553 RepID=UPI0039E42CB9